MYLEDLSPEDQAALPASHALKRMGPGDNRDYKRMAEAVKYTPADAAAYSRLSGLTDGMAESDLVALNSKDPAERLAAESKVSAPRAAGPGAANLSPADLAVEDQIKLRKNNPAWMDPTVGMSGTERALAGAGKLFADTGSGLRQVAGALVNPVTQRLSGRDVIPQDYEGEKERKRLDSSLMDTVGGNVGYMGAGAATLALPASVLARLAAKALPVVAGGTGAGAGAWNVLNAAEGQPRGYLPNAVAAGALSTLTPTTEEGERGVNAALSAAASPVFQGATQLVGKTVRPAAEWVGNHVNLGPALRKSWNAKATPEQKQVVTTAMKSGVPVYPAQLAEPGAAVGRSRSDRQLEALTKSFNKTFGEDTPDIGAAFSGARERLGETFKVLLDGKVVPLGAASGSGPGALETALLAIRAKHNAASPIIEPSKALNDSIDRALSYIKSHGNLTGRQYQDLMRDYAASATMESKGNILVGTKSNPAAVEGFSSMADALAKQAELVMTPAEIKAFRLANKQWRSMKTLESQVPIQVDGQADFNPSAVARKIARADKDAFVYNKGDRTQGDLAKFGATYMGLEANAPHGLLARGKAMVRHAAPLLAADAAGALVAGEALGARPAEGEHSMTEQALKYGALALATHGALTGGRKALNPAVTLNQLNMPRGALSEILQRINLAPTATAAANAQGGE